MGNTSACHRSRSQTRSKDESERLHHDELQKSIMDDLAIPKLSHLRVLRDEKATLIDSSALIFGNVCLRLVNIACRTSQMFPSMMGTYLSVSQHLRQELRKEYPYKDFHIIIADNDSVGFAVGDGEQYAIVQQEQYRIMIFSIRKPSKSHSKTKALNGRRRLQWQSIQIKRK